MANKPYSLAMLTVTAKIERAGAQPVRLQVRSERIEDPNPASIAAEIAECFGKLHAAVREELL